MASDIFISYARKDNQEVPAILGGGTPLVSSFHDGLLANFEELGAPRPTIFRDTQQIERGDQFEPRLQQALVGAKIMVVLLSRNWLESEWCLRELETFVKHWHIRGETEQTIKERILLVRKHDIPPKDRPLWVRGQAGYDLMRVDRENGEEIEYFDSSLGRPINDRWFSTVREIAKDLRNRVSEAPSPTMIADEVAAPSAPSCLPPAAGALTVYVARAAADMEESYKTLIEELVRRGIRPVPDPATVLPERGDRAIAVIDAALAEARVSIHLLGEKLGFQPEDAGPIVRLQLERAAAKTASVAATENSFHRLIWAPRILPGTTEDSPTRDQFEVLAKHSGFTEGRKPQEALGAGDKLDGDTFTKFSQFVLQHLEEISRPAPRPSMPVQDGAEVYVQHDEQDASVADTVAEGLTRLGFSPRMNVIVGDPAGRRRIHRDALQKADAVVLCWARAAPVWVRAAAMELRHWQELGREKAFANRTVVALPPQMADKERMRRFPPKGDVDMVIDASGLGGVVTPPDLERFLRPLRGDGS